MRVSEIISAHRCHFLTPVIDATNVANYWDSLPDGQTFDPRDLPNVTPPFPECFFDVKQRHARFAVHVEAGKRPPTSHPLDSPLFVCRASGYVATGDSSASHMFSAAYLVDDTGACSDCRITPTPPHTFDQAAVVLFVALLTAAFMHCRNVSQSEVVPSAALSRKQMKKRGVPKLAYRVLEISPMTRSLRDEGVAERDGLKLALHICRGHFKTYTADKPLFGRRSGTWWWDASVRASRERGMIVKDYEVKI